MDAEQPQPLRAYGIVYRALQGGGRAEWLLNHRGGSFLVEHPPALDEALARGVWTEDPAASAGALEAALASEDTVPMGSSPGSGVYVPPYAAPWDDAVARLDFARSVREPVGPDVLVAAWARSTGASPSRGLHRPVREQ
jgi:hypothetical protein